MKLNFENCAKTKHLENFGQIQRMFKYLTFKHGSIIFSKTPNLFTSRIYACGILKSLFEDFSQLS